MCSSHKMNYTVFFMFLTRHIILWFMICSIRNSKQGKVQGESAKWQKNINVNFSGEYKCYLHISYISFKRICKMGNNLMHSLPISSKSIKEKLIRHRKYCIWIIWPLLSIFPVLSSDLKFMILKIKFRCMS